MSIAKQGTFQVDLYLPEDPQKTLGTGRVVHFTGQIISLMPNRQGSK